MTLSEIARGRQNTSATAADSSASLGATASYGVPAPPAPVTTTTGPVTTAMDHVPSTMTAQRDSMFNRPAPTYDHSAINSNAPVSMAQ